MDEGGGYSCLCMRFSPMLKVMVGFSKRKRGEAGSWYMSR
jgi:hypothetical protein